MAATQRRYSGEFKARVALAEIQGERTMNEWAGEYGVHPAQIAQGRSGRKTRLLCGDPRKMLLRRCLGS